MYYLDEIMDRTLDSWSTMLGANDFSFWASSEIEMKPTTTSPAITETHETETTTSSPAETPAWEPADTNKWNEEATCDSDSDSSNWNKEESCDSNPISETLQNIAGPAREVIEDINPSTDREPDRD